MNRETIEVLVKKIKKNIKQEYVNQKYNNCLGLIMICANILYQTNIFYRDDDLESFLAYISQDLKLNPYSLEDKDKFDNECIIFYDAFGLNDRGLAQIYIKALCQIKKIVYVTYEDKKNQIPDILKIIQDNNCLVEYINNTKKTKLNQVAQLNEIVKKYLPSQFYFYALPDDVIATSILYAYDGFIQRFQINLTDHAFWLGTGCIDRCIEFRDCGASISKEYRGISEEKIVKIPFYPIIHYEREFEGFPFPVKENQKIIFSGGALYKTIGDDNKYYKIVDSILQNHSDVIFWYAGIGDDSELKKLMKKYPKRVYLTAERSDLFQVLERCCLYLSTYPISGGLMFQYAAAAGKVPVTFKSEDLFDTDGYLINQENINIEFTDVSDLLDEVNDLLTNEQYCISRAYEMRNTVISPEEFFIEIEKIVSGIQSDLFAIKFQHIDIAHFQNLYISRINMKDLYKTLVRRDCFKVCLKYYPIQYFRGILYKIIDEINRRKKNAGY